MFGLPSPGKFLLLLGIVLAVWYGFKLYRRREAVRQAELRKRQRGVTQFDTIECKRCGDYVTAGVRPNCKRPDCPLA